MSSGSAEVIFSVRCLSLKSSKSIIEKLGINTFPTNILIDRLNNKIIWVGTGSNSVIELSEILKQRKVD
jgi:protein-disulfide isomerase-like protein with CxxC motif